jgi:glyoxylase I family protein
MTVLGIGGVFFRSRDPERRAAWYHEHLGIHAGTDVVWQQAAGPTVFAPFPADSDSFVAEQPFMLNLRVSGLDDLVERLRTAGIAVECLTDQDTEYGRFAHLHDPEGLPLELWEPVEGP